MKKACHWCFFLLIATVFAFRAVAEPGDVSAQMVAPPNDYFGNRTVIPPGGGTVMGYNHGAQIEEGELPVLAKDGTNSVWWTWTAPAAGPVTMTTVGSDFDTTLEVSTGSFIDGLTTVATNIESSYDDFSTVTFTAVAGKSYQIRITGVNDEYGNIVLSVIRNGPYAGAPPNDSFAHRITLTGTSISVNGYNTGASKEAEEPINSVNSGGASVWWSWTAPTNGTLVLDTIGSDLDTIMAVYLGGALPFLSELASNDDGANTNNTSKITMPVSAGVTYQIAVDGYNDSVGTIALNLHFIQNDSFANRIQLTGTNITAHGTNIGATLEAGEYTNFVTTATNTVWWTWTAPVSAVVSLDTLGSSFDTVIMVYTNVLGTNSAIQANDNSDGLLTSALGFKVQAGTVYLISVAGVNGQSGSITLHLSIPGVPANDNFANRIHLTGATSTNFASTYNATTEASEHTPLNYTGGRSVWWSWTAPATGQVTIDTHGSTFDTLLGVYTGNSVAGLVTVIENDDDLDNNVSTSRVVTNVVAGTVYQILVDGYNAKFGRAELNIHLVAPPVNDNFAKRTVLTGTSKSVTNSNRLATKEIGEPNHATISGGASLWWTWTPTVTAPVTVSTAGSDVLAVLAVYTGTSVSALSPVASNHGFGTDGQSQLSFMAIKGTAYQIAVDSVGATNGNVVLNFSQAAPVNDQFAKATRLTGAAISLLANNSGATNEVGEPNHAMVTPRATLWWAWKPTSNGTAVITTDGSGIDTALAVYTGTNLTTLLESASNDDDGNTNYDHTHNSTVIFSAVAGTDYKIVVGGFAGAIGPISLKLNLYVSSVTITKSPSNQVVVLNSPVTLSAAATGSGPITCQWYKDGSPLMDQTNTTYTLAHAQNYDAGSYTVYVANYFGGTMSAVGVLIVASEATRPTVAITSPVAAARLTNATFLLQGTATDNALIDHVTVSINGNTANNAIGTASWFLPVTLDANINNGTNLITVKAYDRAGNESLPVSRSVVMLSKISLSTNSPAQGGITRGFTGDYLQVGLVYKLTAVPKPGYILSNWTGIFTSSSNVITFQMSEGLGLTANFVPNPFPAVKGHYNGIYYGTPLTNKTTGQISVDVTDSGSFSGKILSAGASYPFSGVFDSTGVCVFNVPRAGKTPLLAELAGLLPSTNQIYVQLLDDGNYSGGTILRASFNAASNPATNYVGKYTMVISAGSSSMTTPNGYGTATFSIDANGAVNLVGKMPDGSAFSQSTSISTNGSWQVYASTFAGKGCYLAFNGFNGMPASFFQSTDSALLKDTTPGTKLYPNGFQITADNYGYPFVTPPAASAPLITLSVGQIFFFDGNLDMPFDNDVTVGAATVVTGTNHVTLTLNRTTGTVTGSFTHPVTHATVQLNGAVLEGQNTVFGSFSGTNVTGGFFME